MSGMQKILGFDIGITSIGWAYVEGEELKDCGVRIFTKAENPKNGESLALPRREARSTRRRLARRKGRLNAIKRLLCKEFGLNLSDYVSSDGDLPKAYQMSKDTKSPYELRTLALEQKLEPKDFARVILHIAKHRGYGNKHAKRDLEAEEKIKEKIKKEEQENTLKVAKEKESTTTGDSKKEEERVLKALYRNEILFKSYQTVGEYFYKEFEENKQRIRNTTNFYHHTMRQEWLEAELELIFKKQREFGAKFSEEFENKIIKIAFFQRDLKSFEDKVGECIFFEGEKRAAKESLSAIEFVALTRIINTLKNLEEKNKKFGSGEVYGKEQIQKILAIVLEKGAISYKQLREILALSEDIFFAKDSKLDYAKPMQEAEKAKFIEFKNLQKLKNALGGSFEGLERKYIDEIANKITLNKSKENLKKTLADYAKKHQLEQRLNEHLEALSELSFSKHINLSLKALDEILPFMREGMRYDEAIEKAGLKEHRKDNKKDNFLPPLEEYEPYLANPVVARALSEYRKVLNALLKKYEKVHKIHIEFTREIGLSKDEKKAIEKEQKEHFDANESARKVCEDLGLEANKNNLLKIKLWREQGEYCVYSLKKKITPAHLKDPTMLQIDHIYPYSRSFDDSYMNKVLVFTKENQNKIDKTPYEAFSGDKEKWENIVALAQKLPYKKRKRILNTHFNDKEPGFIPRNLNDTGYIARLASNWTKDSLEFEDEVNIAGEKGSKKYIEVVSGSITSMLRHYWGLGDKDRNTHLHHAIDAVIIAYTNAKIIKAFADFKKQREQNKAKLYAKEIAESEYEKQKAFYKTEVGVFRQKVLEKVNAIFVSKPPRKRVRGALHKESFYSFEKLCKDEEYAKKEKMDYGGQKGIERAISLGKIRKIGTKIVSNGAMVRVDIFRDKKGKFYGVPIYTMDFALGILPNKAVVSTPTEYKKKNKDIKDWIEMNPDDFCFSLFKDDLILVQKKEMEKPKLCYFESFDAATASIRVVKHNNKFENLDEDEKILYSSATPQEVVGKGIGIQNLKVFEKYQVSPLGEYQKADFMPRQAIALKSSPKGKQ